VTLPSTSPLEFCKKTVEKCDTAINITQPHPPNTSTTLHHPLTLPPQPRPTFPYAKRATFSPCYSPKLNSTCPTPTRALALTSTPTLGTAPPLQGIVSQPTPEPNTANALDRGVLQADVTSLWERALPARLAPALRHAPRQQRCSARWRAAPTRRAWHA
jgi:hypothetical protein